MNVVDCPFCPIPAPILKQWGVTHPIVAFTPLNPVTPGHVLIVPTEHVENAASDPKLTGHVMQFAAEWGRDLQGDFNIITSSGGAATQTVKHLHVHVVPRRPGDGLHLPWWPRHKEVSA